MNSRNPNQVDLTKLFEDGEKEAHKNQQDYSYSVAYAIADYPLSHIPGYYAAGCSEPVEAGHPLGYGTFCDYFIAGIASTIVIFYNRFEPIAKTNELSSNQPSFEKLAEAITEFERNVSNTFVVQAEIQSKPTSSCVVQLCTGGRIEIPESVTVRSTLLGSVDDGNKTRSLLRIEIDASSDEGRLICQLANEIARLTALPKTIAVANPDGKVQGEIESAVPKALGSMRSEAINVLCTGTSCDNPSYAYYKATRDIEDFALNHAEGCVAMNITRLGRRELRIQHSANNGVPCGRSYSGKVYIDVVFASDTKLGRDIDVDLRGDVESATPDGDRDFTSAFQITPSESVKITLKSVLLLRGVDIPAHPDGYLRLKVQIFQDGKQVAVREIGGTDLTPAGPGKHVVTKAFEESLPPGKYSARFDFTSYWKYGGRMSYSTQATLEGDSEQKWSHQLIAAKGQKNPTYETEKIAFEIIKGS